MLSYFSKSALTYDSVAWVHHISASSLMNQIKRRCQEPLSIVDVGCGSGIVLEKCKEAFPQADLLGCDLSSSMLQIASQKVPEALFFQTDVLALKQKATLWLAHFSLQWMSPYTRYLEHMLKQCSYLAVAVPIEGSFESWSELLKSLRYDSTLLKLPIRADFSPFEKRVIFSEIKEYPMAFDRPIDFAYYLKALGALHSQSKTNQCLPKALFKPQKFTTSYKVLELIMKGDL